MIKELKTVGDYLGHPSLMPCILREVDNLTNSRSKLIKEVQSINSSGSRKVTIKRSPYEFFEGKGMIPAIGDLLSVKQVMESQDESEVICRMWLAEFMLILEKKSNLSKAQRDFVKMFFSEVFQKIKKIHNNEVRKSERKPPKPRKPAAKKPSVPRESNTDEGVTKGL